MRNFRHHRHTIGVHDHDSIHSRFPALVLRPHPRIAGAHHPATSGYRSQAATPSPASALLNRPFVLGVALPTAAGPHPPPQVASQCSHLAKPELQKLIDGNRASAGRNEIKQHQCVHHFRLVKPIVDTICRVNRFVARNCRWRATEQMTRRPRAASGVRNPTATPRPPKNSTPGTNHCNMPMCGMLRTLSVSLQMSYVFPYS